MEETKKVAFLGTGLMGFPMAQNILKSGYNVTVFNRSPAKANPLLEVGAKIAATPTEATEGAEIIITMLSDGTAVQEILESDKLKASLAENSIWIDMSSAKPADARTQALILKPLGVEHLDAPVSGGTAGAESASLAIMVGVTSLPLRLQALSYPPWGGRFMLVLAEQGNWQNWPIKRSLA